MKEDVENWVSSCLCCQQSKAPHKGVWRSLWEKMPLPAPPGCLVQVALKESLPEIPVNNKDLLNVSQLFSRVFSCCTSPQHKKLADIKYTIAVETSGLSACAKTKMQLHICRSGEGSVSWVCTRQRGINRVCPAQSWDPFWTNAGEEKMVN